MKKLVWYCGLFLVLSAPAMAQDNSQVEIYGGYSHVQLNVGPSGFGFSGGGASFSISPSKWWGLIGDFGAYHSGAFGANSTAISYLRGPKFSYRKAERTTPFAQSLFGGMHLTQRVGGICNGGSACNISPRLPGAGRRAGR